MTAKLGYWKYKPGEYLDNEQVFALRGTGETADGLETLDTAEISSRICAALSAQSENGTIRGEDGLAVTISDKFVYIECSERSSEHLDTVCEIMYELGIPMYDAQLPMRFDTDIIF